VAGQYLPVIYAYRLVETIYRAASAWHTDCPTITVPPSDGMGAEPLAMVTVKIGGTFRLSPFLPALEELVDEIRENGSDGQITYRPPTGRGITLYETIGLYIALRAADASIGNVVTQVETAAINWAKARFRRKRDDDESSERKKIITIYGPNGNPIKKIKVDSADDIEVTDED
jgi:hypothetical protein